MKNKFIVLYGPTGVGKTDVGLLIANEMNAEIINMDVGQFYAPFSVGTAKPDWKNSSIPHHLFDCIDKPINFSVIMYKNRVLDIMNTLWAKGKVPLLIGGSGFYLYSLLFQISSGNSENKEKGFSNDDGLENRILWQKLQSLDVERASKIHQNDRYRILRALQICEQKQSIPSLSLPKFKPIAACDIIFLSRDRGELYNRINKRAGMMFSNGFVSEVDSILNTPWEEFVLRKKLIGYDELVLYMRQKEANSELSFSINLVQERIAQRTRQYAKRQYTFWRYLEKQLIINKNENSFDCRKHIVHLTSTNEEGAMKEILKYVKN